MNDSRDERVDMQKKERRWNFPVICLYSCLNTNGKGKGKVRKRGEERRGRGRKGWDEWQERR